MITPPDLTLFAICWVKVRGYKDWPGVVEEHSPNGKYGIHFFGDNSRAYVNKKQITNFYEGFGLFKKTFDDMLLKKAIQEAVICLSSNTTPTSCFVCDIIEHKRKMYKNKVNK